MSRRGVVFFSFMFGHMRMISSWIYSFTRRQSYARIVNAPNSQKDYIARSCNLNPSWWKLASVVSLTLARTSTSVNSREHLTSWFLFLTCVCTSTSLVSELSAPPSMRSFPRAGKEGTCGQRLQSQLV